MAGGVHANGFTLARRVLEEEDYDGEDLLAPTRLYLDVARSLKGRAKAFVHVTGRIGQWRVEDLDGASNQPASS